MIWQENLHVVLAFDQLSGMPGSIRKKWICILFLELSELVIHLFKEITFDIDKQCRVFSSFHGYRHRSSQFERCLAIHHEVGGFGTLQFYFEVPVAADQVRTGSEQVGSKRNK